MGKVASGVITVIDGERVVAMRIRGCSVRAIARRFKCSSEDVHEILDSFATETLTSRLRTHTMALELERLDRLTETFERMALAGDIQAGQLVLKIVERRDVLLGLAVPSRVEHIHELSARPSETTSTEKIRQAIERIRSAPSLPKPSDEGEDPSSVN